jgi:phosphate transport system substrate-binding protein
MRRTASKVQARLVGLVLGLGAAWCHAQAPVELNGAGSTFAAPWYAAVSETLGLKAQFRVNYDAVGSGEGIKRISERRVDFGASDRPLTRKELADGGFLQLPTAIGGVVVTAQLPGVAVDQLRLDAALLGDLFLGRITRWNDARIAVLNPGLRLPALAVTPIFREDSSGTSFLFTTYLARTHAAWKASHGVTSRLRLPGAIGAEGNGGVVKALQARPGSIGYLEYTYARGNGFPAAQLRNAFGQWVQPDVASVEASVRAADWERLFIDSQPTFEIDTIDVGCPRCWPIVGLTYVIAPRRWGDSGKAEAFRRFVEGMMNDGDALAREESYVPLPSRAKNLVRVTLRSQLPAGGRAAAPAIEPAAGDATARMKLATAARP